MVIATEAGSIGPGDGANNASSQAEQRGITIQYMPWVAVTTAAVPSTVRNASIDDANKCVDSPLSERSFVVPLSSPAAARRHMMHNFSSALLDGTGKQDSTCEVLESLNIAVEPLAGPATSQSPLPDPRATNRLNSPQRNSQMPLRKRKYSAQEDGNSLVSEVSESKRCKIDSHLAPPRKAVLLAMQTDAAVLSPIHVFIRQQIEVFEATQDDIEQPAPGRKTPILLNQVGLRCIHCRDLSPRDRVKRAVCYPSSVGRVYNSVSDMKFDHFGSCKGFSSELRARFEELKSAHKVPKSKPSTPKTGLSTSAAQYYHDSARHIGMVDGKGGVFLANMNMMNMLSDMSASSSLFNELLKSSLSSDPPSISSVSTLSLPLDIQAGAQDLASSNSSKGKLKRSKSAAVSSDDSLSSAVSKISTGDMDENDFSRVPPASPLVPCDRRLLSSPKDGKYLSPIHCFVRKHIEVFAATPQDVAAPSPGRKSRIYPGQVGIRCIHCVANNSNKSAKQRVKRAVCYPPSVSGIYHCVSNMKFDHFDRCTGLDTKSRAEFHALRAATGSRNSGSGSKQSSKSVSNSTAQYYHDSAIYELGLVDTDQGIRFKSAGGPSNQANAGDNSKATAADSSSSSSLSSVESFPDQQRQAKQQQPQREAPTNKSTPSPPVPGASQQQDKTKAVSTQKVVPKNRKLPRRSHPAGIPDGLNALMIAAADPSVQMLPIKA
jgi:hypothetical protein